MTYIINRLCTREGDCVEVCPVECIVPGPTNDPKWNDLFFIDPDTCIDCGACAPECPVEGAITPEDEVPAEFKDDIRRNYDFFSSGPAYWDCDVEAEKKTFKGKPKTADWKAGVKPW